VTENSPLVTADGWGYIEIAGLGRLRDAKLWPGGGRAWDWHETGTEHHPGIQPEDIAELLEHDPDLVVLGCGRQGRLAVCPETLSLLQQRGLDTVCDETAAAISTYQAMTSQGRRVAGLFHTTC
jgi:hypothetical protein